MALDQEGRHGAHRKPRILSTMAEYGSVYGRVHDAHPTPRSEASVKQVDTY